ncbi:MAG: HAD family hydrolase [Candidatus Omnitrophica bacterium]|nr:HAD family hydrolase [Candidatus Omnitrophota bacterium]
MKGIIFLDRDGVINRYPGNFKYVDSEDNFVFLQGSKEAIALLYKAGYLLFVISNQAGVTKGIYPKQTLDNITQIMLKEIEEAGGKIAKILYCMHTDEQNCDCRKPKIGLITKALEGISLASLKDSYFVGDSIRDVKTGKGAGCKTILVLSGREKIENKQAWEVQPDFIAENLYKATEIILSKEKKK